MAPCHRQTTAFLPDPDLVGEGKPGLLSALALPEPLYSAPEDGVGAELCEPGQLTAQGAEITEPRSWPPWARGARGESRRVPGCVEEMKHHKGTRDLSSNFSSPPGLSLLPSPSLGCFKR